MKRNLLSSAIIVAIMALGITGCDDKKAETETPPPANSQPAAPLLKRNRLNPLLQKQKCQRNRWLMNKRFSTKK